jgi:hypothetical protein
MNYNTILPMKNNQSRKPPKLKGIPKAEATGLDRRSLPKTSRLVRDLSEFRPKEIGQELGISYQKYVALRRKVEADQVSTPGLNDRLERALSRLSIFKAQPQDQRGEYTSEAPIRGKRKFKIDFVEAGEKYIKENMKWARKIKGPGSKQSVLNWYGGVTGGKEYFWIVKDKRGRYSVYDIRTNAEKSRKGRASDKGLKAIKLKETTHAKSQTRASGGRTKKSR